MVKIDSNNSAELVISGENNISRRQEAPVVYDVTTVCYVVNPQFVLTHSGIFEGRVCAVKIPVERSIDIDTVFDFKVAELLLS